MKRTEKVTETKEVDRVVEHRCDICGESVETWESEEQFKATVGAEPRGYNDNASPDVSLSMSTGYPEFRSETKWTVDVCPRCFVTKLIPFVESHGRAKITPTEDTW